MSGRTHADMVLADDGLYVVKWKENPQHRRVLINELIAAKLLRHLNVASPGNGP